VKRRELWAAAAILASGAPAAEPDVRTYRLGVLAPDPRSLELSAWDVFVEALAKRGYVEGRNLVIERRVSRGGQANALEAAASDLVALKVDLIVAAGGTASALAAKRVTTIVPIVFVSSSDPVGFGIVSSLDRPGANITGTSIFGAEVAAKSVQYLAQAVGKLTSIAVISSARAKEHPWFIDHINALKAGAKAMGARTDFAEYAAVTEAEPMVKRLVAQGVQGLCHVGDNRTSLEEMDFLAALAIKYRLPAIGSPDRGFLLICGPSMQAAARRTAYYVDRVFKGALPRDLPVEELCDIQLVINSNTAKAIGLALPRSLLLRADKLIE